MLCYSNLNPDSSSYIPPTLWSNSVSLEARWPAPQFLQSDGRTAECHRAPSLLMPSVCQFYAHNIPYQPQLQQSTYILRAYLKLSWAELTSSPKDFMALSRVGASYLEIWLWCRLRARRHAHIEVSISIAQSFDALITNVEIHHRCIVFSISLLLRNR